MSASVYVRERVSVSDRMSVCVCLREKEREEVKTS